MGKEAQKDPFLPAIETFKYFQNVFSSHLYENFVHTFFYSYKVFLVKVFNLVMVKHFGNHLSSIVGGN